MSKFPVDAPRSKVLKALGRLGFQLVRQGARLSMVRQNSDGTRTPLTLPNHPHIKASTLRAISRAIGHPAWGIPPRIR